MVRFLAAAYTVGLLVVVVGVLTGMIGKVTDHGPGDSAGCRNNLRQIALACEIYAQDNDECFPERLEQLYPEYIDNTKVYSCRSAPSSHEDFEGGKVTKESSSYLLVPGLLTTTREDTILLYEKSANNHQGDGRNVAFVDAHVEWMREAKFQAALKKQWAELAKLKAAGK